MIKEKNTYEVMSNKYKKIVPFLGEPARRIWAVTEAESLGYGG